MRVGKVFLVGAGPGDPGLLTLKGRDCLRRAQVLVYDRLVGENLLSLVPPEAEKIYVGKSPQKHTLRQEEINQLLVAKAREGKRVVRLKGGDPFVFGRGGEEAQALAREGIPFEVVPGVTAAVAAPAYAGIPVTHRGFASSLGIITGSTDPATKEAPGLPWGKISGLETLIFLMGMANLPTICQKLTENGCSPVTPVALIRWGTTPRQETLVGTLADIVSKAREAGFKSPAVIVVGEVVGLREQLNWFERQPLFGKRIVVTRPRDQAGGLVQKIEALGGEAIEFPTIEIAPPEDYGPLDRALDKIREYQWLIFTSVNGVAGFFKRLYERGGEVRDLYGIKLATIGPRTREELEKWGVRVYCTPGEYRAEALAEVLGKEGIKGQKVLLPRAPGARRTLPESLEKMGAVVEEVPAYRTLPAKKGEEKLREALCRREVHGVTFTSSSTVRHFVETFCSLELPQLLKGVVVASLGPVTTATVRELGLEVTVEAESYTVDGLVAALQKYWEKPKPMRQEAGL